jgi:hypothetical protein
MILTAGKRRRMSQNGNIPCKPEILTLIYRNIEHIIFVDSLGLTEWLITQKIKAWALLGHALLGVHLCLPTCFCDGRNPWHTQ